MFGCLDTCQKKMSTSSGAVRSLVPFGGRPPPVRIEEAMLQQTLLLLLLLQYFTLTLGQYEICKSLLRTNNGKMWEFYACQPKSMPMKEFTQIKVEPPGITCGNPPERFCTLVSFVKHVKMLQREIMVNI
ncbi:netrin-G2 isoform X1 [Arapaima gigas]